MPATTAQISSAMSNGAQSRREKLLSDADTCVNTGWARQGLESKFGKVLGQTLFELVCIGQQHTGQFDESQVDEE